MKDILTKLYIHDKEQWFSLQDEEGNTKMQKQSNGKALCLSEDFLDKHLSGDITLCLQPIQIGTNKTKYGSIDFDAEDASKNKLILALNDALKIKKIAEEHGIPVYISFSGRRGWHLYVFSKSPVPAGIMRKALYALARLAGYKAKEIYPSSDYISINYYPRPLKLTPGKHKLGNWAGFVYPERIRWENDKPRLPHQLKFMQGIKQADVVKILDLAQQVEDRPEIDFKDIHIDWEQLSPDHPPCIQYMLTKGAPYSMDYNRANMTLVRYGLNRGLPESAIKNLGQQMAVATVDHSSTKNTLDKRIQNLMSSLWSMRKKPEKHQWVCSFVRSVDELRSLCKECNLNNTEFKKADSKPKLQSHSPESNILHPNNKPILPCPSLMFVESVHETEVVLSVLNNYHFLGLDLDIDEQDRLRFMGLATQHNKVYIFDIEKIGDMSVFKEMLESTALIKVMFDAKPILKCFYKAGLQIGNIMDTMLLGQVALAGEEKQPVNLDEFSSVFLRYSLPDRKKSNASFETIFATRCSAIVGLSKVLYDKVSDAGLRETAMLECACAKTLARMELNGIKLADKKLTYASADIKAKVKALRDSLIKSLSVDVQPIDLNSSEAVRAALARKNIKVPNTKEATLRPYAQKHQFVRELIDYRSLKSMSSTYSTSLLKHINPDTRRIHTHFNQLGASTGRPTSERPCTTNWPNGKFRELIIAEPGNMLVVADYSQIQMVILAEVSQDPKLLKIFRNGQDVHIMTASWLLGKDPDKVTSEERRKIKAVNYGLVFDMQDRGLAMYAQTNFNVHMTEQEARDYRKNYFNLYEGVSEWRIKIKKESIANHSTRTLGNRRRLFTTRFYEVDTDKPDVVRDTLAGLYIDFDIKDGIVIMKTPDYLAFDFENGLRAIGVNFKWFYVEPKDSQLYNTPIQGAEADILKLALVRVEQGITPLNGKIINCAYDEIVVEVPRNNSEEVARITEQEMVQAAAHYLKSVPLAVGVKVGSNWAVK